MDWSLINTAVLGALGEPVPYQPRDGAAFQLDAVVSIGEREDAYGELFAKLEDFPAPPQKGDIVTIKGVDCVVVNDPRNDEDGIGGVTLILRLA